MEKTKRDTDHWADLTKPGPGAENVKIDGEQVVVVWKDGHGGFGLLSFRDGPRVYDRGNLDHRLAQDMPYFATLKELVERSAPGTNNAALIPLTEAQKHGLVT